MARYTRFAQVFTLIGCCASLFSTAVLDLSDVNGPKLEISNVQALQSYLTTFGNLPDYWQTFFVFYLLSFLTNIFFAFYMILDTNPRRISIQIVMANFVFVMNIGCFLIFHYITEEKHKKFLNSGYIILLMAVTSSMGTCTALVVGKLQRDRDERHKRYHKHVDSIIHAQNYGTARNSTKIYHTGISNEAFTMGASIEGVDLSHYI